MPGPPPVPGPTPLPRPVPSPDPTPPPVPGPAPAELLFPVPAPVDDAASSGETTCCAGWTGVSTGGLGSGGFTGGTVCGVNFGIVVGSDFTRTNSTRCSREPSPSTPPPPPPARPGPPPPTTSARVKSLDPTIGPRMRKRITACTSSDAMTPFQSRSFRRGISSRGN